MLGRIELEAERLNEMIGRLLTLARLEDAGTVPAATDVSLNEVVESVGADAEFEAQARKCRVKCTLPAEELKVRGEASLLHSAIENVVRNAVRYTGEDTQVEVTLEKSGAEALVKVTDAGPGVAQESLGKLFQPFYRIDDARGRQTGGVGLGLSITDRAIRLHGGSVVASNRAEGGLLVEIRLPLAG
jgi:two-component system, OmpR family, sensor histidine kinase CpxA